MVLFYRTTGAYWSVPMAALAPLSRARSSGPKVHVGLCGSHRRCRGLRVGAGEVGHEGVANWRGGLEGELDLEITHRSDRTLPHQARRVRR